MGLEVWGPEKSLGFRSAPLCYAVERNYHVASRPFGEEDCDKLLEQIGRDDSSSGATVLSIGLCSIDSALSFLWHDDTCNPVVHMWV
jgi:hypothetical protein